MFGKLLFLLAILGLVLLLFLEISPEPLLIPNFALQVSDAQTTYFALYLTPFFIVILAWVIIAFIVRRDAKHREKSPNAWFIIVLLTGIIGALIYYLRRKEVLL